MSEVLIRAVKNLVVETMQQWVPLVARIFLSLIFVMAALGKIMDPAGTRQTMTEAGLPVAGLLLPVVIVWLLAGGVSVLAGFRARLGALALIVFLIPASLLFHGFWAYEPGTEAFKLQMIMFLKNVGLMGGLLLLLPYGSGPCSVDSALGRCDRN